MKSLWCCTFKLGIVFTDTETVSEDQEDSRLREIQGSLDTMSVSGNYIISHPLIFSRTDVALHQVCHHYIPSPLFDLLTAVQAGTVKIGVTTTTYKRLAPDNPTSILPLHVPGLVLSIGVVEVLY